MPRRSNEFQRLIETIHHQLAAGASVSESVLLEDRVTHELREVDIAIETTVAGSLVRLGVECCDLSRKASVEWVEQMCCKHDDLPTDKLLLVSRSGFTKAALAKASRRGVEALLFADAARVSWTSVVDRLGKIYFDATEVRTLVFPDTEANPQNLAATLSQEVLLATSDGRSRPQLRQVVDALLQAGPIRPRVIDSLAEGEDKGFIVEFQVLPGTRIVEPNGSEREVVSVLRVVVLTKRRRYPLSLRTGIFKDFQVGFAEAEGDLGTVTLVVLEREGHPLDALVVRRHDGSKDVIPLTGARTREFNAAPNEVMRALFGGAV